MAARERMHLSLRTLMAVTGAAASGYRRPMNDDGGWLGEFLLGHEGRQIRDIRRASATASEAAFVGREAVARATALQARVDRLELVCEALLHLLLKRGLCSRQELAVLMTQIDLRDGVEDGVVQGDSPRRGAPLCRTCELPINPERDACVYCDTPIVKDVAAPPPTRAVRMVTCSRCAAEVEEERTYFTGAGLCCDRCHAQG